MTLASTIGFLFGTHNIANDLVKIDPRSGFTRKRNLSGRPTRSTELVQQAHQKRYVKTMMDKTQGVGQGLLTVPENYAAGLPPPCGGGVIQGQPASETNYWFEIIRL